MRKYNLLKNDLQYLNFCKLHKISETMKIKNSQIGFEKQKITKSF